MRKGFFSNAVLGNRGKLKRMSFSRIMKALDRQLHRFSCLTLLFLVPLQQLSIRSVAYLLPSCYPSLLITVDKTLIRLTKHKVILFLRELTLNSARAELSETLPLPVAQAESKCRGPAKPPSGTRVTLTRPSFLVH